MRERERLLLLRETAIELRQRRKRERDNNDFIQMLIYFNSQEKIRTKQLEDSIQKTDELIYQMIPKQIADKLRNGETPLNTCKVKRLIVFCSIIFKFFSHFQVFTSVSILFSDIVSFTPMCARLRPMEVVSLLNAMYVAFDNLCEVHHVYKVSTSRAAG